MGIELCLKKVLAIIRDVEILCENNGSQATSAALYTIAVKEYGKFLILKKILNSKLDQDNNLYAVDKSIFKNHKEKFIRAIESLSEVCIDYNRRDISENENLLPKSYRKKMLALREALDSLKRSTGISASGTISVTSDFEIRKNLLYVYWNDLMNNWTIELIKDDMVEYNDAIEELEEEKDWDDSLDSEWEKLLERSEENARYELEDSNLDVIDVDYKNVRRLQHPKNLVYAAKFFRKFIKQTS
jgi:AbiV family abortive infection protein